MNAEEVPASVPSQDPSLVKDVVGFSHTDLKKVRDLVERQPELARATIDWGFGDWESALDAASHVGRREIAEFLISKGARPTIFSAAMMGQLEVVKAFVAAWPGIQKSYGPHGITLLAHAKAGGKEAEAVARYLVELGDANIPLPTQALSPEEREAVVGNYVFGPGARDLFSVDVVNKRLGIQRPGGISRNLLHHAGKLEFYPSGAPNVRIVFQREGETVTSLTLRDGARVIEAKRAA